MKKVFRVILMAVIAIASVSCMALHKVTMLPSTSLERNNYTYVRNIRAQINYTYIFGIGGLRNKDVIEKLTDAANLLPGEALANAILCKPLHKRNYVKS